MKMHSEQVQNNDQKTYAPIPPGFFLFLSPTHIFYLIENQAYSKTNEINSTQRSSTVGIFFFHLIVQHAERDIL